MEILAARFIQRDADSEQSKLGLQENEFSWSTPRGLTATGFKVFRADVAEGPFSEVANLPTSVNSYTDYNLKNGWQYFYEVGVVYPTGVVRSAPFVLTPKLNNDLIANGSFEEDDNSHWDKWFTGDISWTNMAGSTFLHTTGSRAWRSGSRTMGTTAALRSIRITEFLKIIFL